MSGPGDAMRRRTLVRLAAASGVAALAGAASLWRPGSSARAEAGRSVLPRFREQAADLALVMITTAKQGYHLVRDPDGWVLPERGLHPVRPDRVQDLATALAEMRFERAMTRDERKLDSIGLGDPLTGGAGALVEAGDGRGNVFANLIIGRRDSTAYVRFRDDLQAWAVAGPAPPPLHRPAAWFDLGWLQIDPRDIDEVSVQVTGAGSYAIRVGSMRGGREAFVVAGSGPAPLEQDALASVWMAATQMSPTDGALAEEVLAGLSPWSRHGTRVRSGERLVLQTYRSGRSRWVVPSWEGAPESAGSGSRASMSGRWAYAVSDATLTALGAS